MKQPFFSKLSSYPFCYAIQRINLSKLIFCERWNLLANFYKTSYDGKLSLTNSHKLTIPIIFVIKHIGGNMVVRQFVWFHGEVPHHATRDFHKAYLNHYQCLPNSLFVLSFIVLFTKHLSLALICMAFKSMDSFEQLSRRSTTYVHIMKLLLLFTQEN